MPARMLSGDGGEYRATLLNMGLRIATSSTARNLLTNYLQSRNPEEFATCTDRIGWHGGRAFVLPRETIGDDAERIYFQTDKTIENTFSSKGTPDKWNERVGALCVGNSRTVLAYRPPALLCDLATLAYPLSSGVVQAMLAYPSAQALSWPCWPILQLRRCPGHAALGRCTGRGGKKSRGHNPETERAL